MTTSKLLDLPSPQQSGLKVCRANMPYIQCIYVGENTAVSSVRIIVTSLIFLIFLQISNR